MSRTRIKDIDRNGYAVTVQDPFTFLKAKGESILACQHGSRNYRGKNVMLIITDKSQYVAWQDMRKHYS